LLDEAERRPRRLQGEVTATHWPSRPTRARWTRYTELDYHSAERGRLRWHPENRTSSARKWHPWSEIDLEPIIWGHRGHAISGL